jgi:hypothetical protein
MGQIGLWAGHLLELDPGSTVLTASTAMSTIAMIRIMVIMGPCPREGRNSSITFRLMKRMMLTAT